MALLGRYCKRGYFKSHFLEVAFKDVEKEFETIEGLKRDDRLAHNFDYEIFWRY